MSENKLLSLISEIKIWATVYEINLQFWPGNNNAYVYKNGVLFLDTGGFETMEEIMTEVCTYLRMVNPSFAKRNNLS